MSKKRFLRDNVLQDMLDNFEKLAQLVNESESKEICPAGEQDLIRMMFETNHTVLERLEETIEGIKNGAQKDELNVSLTEAAMHIQTATRSIHDILMGRVDARRDDLDDLIDEIDFEL